MRITRTGGFETFREGDPIRVTKVEAAWRQLRTALELWFRNADPVSIHTLAYSAYRVVFDLKSKSDHKLKDPLELGEWEYIKPEFRAEWRALVSRDAGFFKHADRKDAASAVLEFQPKGTEMFLLFAIAGLQCLGEKPPWPWKAFVAWLHLHRPEILKDDVRRLYEGVLTKEQSSAARRIDRSEYLKIFERMARDGSASG